MAELKKGLEAGVIRKAFKPAVITIDPTKKDKGIQVMFGDLNDIMLCDHIDSLRSQLMKDVRERYLKETGRPLINDENHFSKWVKDQRYKLP